MIIDLRLSRACIDIDGVLCRDPYPSLNRDHLLYVKFLAEVLPLFKTDIPLGILVSARLLKYRPIVVSWLEKNNFKYQDLVLFDAPNLHVRDAMGFKKLVLFKHKVLVDSGYDLFILSGLAIARCLNTMAPWCLVYCTENNKFVRLL